MELLRTKTFTDVPGFEGKEVTIRNLTHGEKCDIRDKCLEIGLVGGKEQAMMKTGKMSLYITAAGLKTAPFLPPNWEQMGLEAKYEVVKNMDDDAGERVYKEVSELSTPSVEAKK